MEKIVLKRSFRKIKQKGMLDKYKSGFNKTKLVILKPSEIKVLRRRNQVTI